jgi:hypothetical protein
MIGAALIGLLLAQSACTTTKNEILHHAHYADEFFASSTLHRATLNTEKVDIGPPIVDFQIDTSTLSLSQQYSAGLVYRLMVLLYQSEPGLEMPVVKITGSDEITSSSGGYVIGTASMNTKTITMYTRLIEDPDTFMIVLIHEFLHLLGFGTLSSPSKLSFTARSNPLTLVHDSPIVKECLEADPGLTLYTDRTLSHWNITSSLWEEDIMLPIVSMHTKLSRCSLMAVLESREWSTTLCTINADCKAPLTCQTLGPHMVRACQTVATDQKHHREKKIEIALSQMAIFSSLVAIFFTVILLRTRWHHHGTNISDTTTKVPS